MKHFFELNNLSVDNVIVDDKIHRCTDTTKGKKNSDGWYSAHPKDDGIILVVGSYLRGFDEKYFIPSNGNAKSLGRTEHAPIPSTHPPDTPPPKIDWVKKWQRAKSYGVNSLPYVQKKGIDAQKAGLKKQYQNLLTPVQNINGELIGIHYINSDNGDRFFGKDSQQKGGFFPLGQIEKSNRIFLFEGISDAISIHDSTDECCVNCFSVYNIRNILSILIAIWPEKEYVVCSDNDETGFKYGNNYAFEFSVKIALPPVPNSDWNDFYRQNGIEATRIALEAAITEPQKIVEHTKINKATDDELRSVVSNCVDFLENEVFPTHLEKTKLGYLKELYEFHKDSPYLKECVDKIQGITGSTKLANIREKLASYLNIEKHCDNITRICDDELVNGKYLPADKFISLMLKTDFFKRKEPIGYCVQSPLGSGKTEIINKLIQVLDNQTSNHYKTDVIKGRILYLTPRQTLTNASSKRLGLNDYMAIKELKELENGDAKKEAARRMACTINSLPNMVAEDFSYDIIVIDEIELFIAHILGSTIRNKKRLLEHLYSLLKNAKIVIGLDGFLGLNSIEMLRKAGISKIHGIVNEHQPWKNVDVNWYIQGQKEATVQKMVDILKKGKAVAVATNSRKQSEILFEGLREKAGKEILFNRYTAPLEEQQNVIAQPDTASEYDLVVFTPTLESGVSFDLSEFEIVFGFFEPMSTGVGTPLACVQQMGRFRQAKEWHIYCPNKEFDLPTTTESVKRIVANRFETAKRVAELGDEWTSFDFSKGIQFEDTDIIDSEVAELFALATKWENIQKTTFAWSLYAFIEMMGCEIGFKNHKNVMEGIYTYEHGKNVMVTSHAQAILAADDFESEDDFRDFMNTATQREKAEARFQIQRHVIQREYCEVVAQDNIYSLLECEDKRILGLVRNLETALIPPPINNFYVKHNVEGWNDDGMNKKDEIEKIHSLPLASHVRRLALQVYDLVGNFGYIPTLDDNGIESKDDGIDNFFTQVLVCNDDIKDSEFYHFCLKNQKVINNSHIGFKVTKSFINAPGQTLSAVLQQCGFFTTRTQTRLSISQKEKMPPVNVGTCHTLKNISVKDKDKGVTKPYKSRVYMYQIDWEREIFDGFTVLNLWELAIKRDLAGKNWVWKNANRIAQYQLKQELKEREFVQRLESERAVELAERELESLYYSEYPSEYEEQPTIVEEIISHLSTMLNAVMGVSYYAMQFGIDATDLINQLGPAIESGQLKWQAGGYRDTGFLSLPT